MAQASNLIDSEQRFAQIIAGSEKDELKTISGPEDLWPLMREEAERKAKEEPILGSYFPRHNSESSHVWRCIEFSSGEQTRQPHVAHNVNPRRHSRGYP